MDDKGHPLPASDEARHNEIPERVEQDKGHGDDPCRRLQPRSEPVEPDGSPYAYGDLGRGPDDADGETEEELADDQAAHQDRGQAISEAEGRRR